MPTTTTGLRCVGRAAPSRRRSLAPCRHGIDLARRRHRACCWRSPGGGCRIARSPACLLPVTAPVLSGVGRAAARPSAPVSTAIARVGELIGGLALAAGRGTRIVTGTGGAESRKGAGGSCARPRTRSDAGRLKSSRLCCTASSIQWCAGPCLAVQAVRRLRCFSTSERCLGAAASEGRTPGRIPYQPRCNLYRSGSKNFLSFLLFLGKKSVCRFFQWGIIETGKSDADRRRGHPDSPLITESVPRRTESGGGGPCM